MSKFGLDLNANLTAHVGAVEEAKEAGVTREMHPSMPTADATSVLKLAKRLESLVLQSIFMFD
jgi:hypothetical protein